MITITRRAALMALASLAGSRALAQSVPKFPNHPIRFIIPAGAGGPSDTVGRIVGREISEPLGVPIVNVNVPGANSIIGTGQAARAKPDGYTFVVASLNHVVNSLLTQDMPYDWQTSFVPVGRMVDMASVIVVHPSLPVKNFQEFIQYARANPGQLRWALGSAGSSDHLGGSMLASRAGLDFLQVPYSSAAPALQDLLGGHADFKIESVGTALPHIRAGLLRAIATTASTRSPLLPQVPTVAESGFPGFSLTAWVTLWAPAGTPAPVVERINVAVNKALATPKVEEELRALGAVPTPSTPSQLAEFARAEHDKWQKVLATSKR